MARMAFDTRGCMGVDSGVTGKRYNAKDGIINVTDNRDIKAFADNGYTLLGTAVRASKYWTCDDCSRDCSINHCAKCGSEDLRKVIA